MMIEIIIHGRGGQGGKIMRRWNCPKFLNIYEYNYHICNKNKKGKVIEVGARPEVALYPVRNDIGIYIEVYL